MDHKSEKGESMEIKVCIGSACHIKGSYNIITQLQNILEDDEINGDRIELSSAFCLQNCQNGVSVQIDDDPEIYSVTPKTVKDFYNNIVIPKL